MKYLVTLLYDASETIEVEADDVQSAINLAHGQAEAHLCYHCARHLDLGDVYREEVSDEAGNEVRP